LSVLNASRVARLPTEPTGVQHAWCGGGRYAVGSGIVAGGVDAVCGGGVVAGGDVCVA
jgi:hypothetical protein